MRASCRRHLVISSVAALAWLAVLWLIVFPPASNEPMRLPYFAVLGVAIGSTSLAVLPWLLAGFIHSQVLAYVAGLMHNLADEQQSARPDLRIVED